MDGLMTLIGIAFASMISFAFLVIAEGVNWINNGGM